MSGEECCDKMRWQRSVCGGCSHQEAWCETHGTTCGCARAVLASDWLAALLDRVRREAKAEAGEQIAQAIEVENAAFGVSDDPYTTCPTCRETNENEATTNEEANVGAEENEEQA